MRKICLSENINPFIKKGINIVKVFAINLTIILSSILILILALEGFLRIFKSNQILSPGTYISHPTRRYTLRPNFSGKTLGRPYKINSSGLRDYEYSMVKPKGVFRILSVGDSCTFGVGLSLEDTYPKQLEQLLRSSHFNKKIEVINCGIPSYNTAYEYLYLKEELLKYNPDLIIIEYVYNDSVFNYVLTSSKHNFLNSFKDKLRTLYSYEFLLDKIYRLEYVIKGFTQRDPGIRRENLRYVYSDQYIGWHKNKEAFGLLEEMSRENKIPVVYVIFPKLERLERDYPYGFYHKTVKDALKREPYVLDLLPYFIGEETEKLWVTSYDSHPNGKANKIITKAILDFIVSKNITID